MVKPNPFQCTVSKVFSIYFNSRSGRRGRMSRHMRDNMASREGRSEKWSSEGGHSPLFGIVWDDVLCSLSMCKRRVEDLLPRICPPLSSPGVCGTNPPEKPTGKFYKPNRQWCGAPRGGGEGSPRARVSFERQKYKQHERACCNLSAFFAHVADRQQQGRSSGHGRAASSTARTRTSWIMDLLNMIKWYNFHIREDQQNMGTGNAFFQRCLYPFLRPLEFFNRPMSPLCKTVRAGVAI